MSDEKDLDIDVPLVRSLLTSQFPQWTNLPIEAVPSNGCDNAIFRLGDAMAMRLPRVPRATAQVDKEQYWLPKLAPHLPLTIPTAIGRGSPGHGYPWPWSIYSWIRGENATFDRLHRPSRAATALAEFTAALQRVDTDDGPPSGPQNEFRGVPLAMRDPLVRAALSELRETIDADAATTAWEASLNVSPWRRPPVWIHGDLHSGNLLAQDGRIVAVIDFGLLGVGDPACDVMVAWWLFSGSSRDRFRTVSGVDDDTWLRGRGWALSVALIALAHYLNNNPALVRTSSRALAAVLDDQTRNP